MQKGFFKLKKDQNCEREKKKVLTQKPKVNPEGFFKLLYHYSRLDENIIFHFPDEVKKKLIFVLCVSFLENLFN